MKRWGLDKIHMNCSRHWRYLPLWKDSSEFWLPFTLSSPLIRLWLVPAFYVIFPYDKIHPYELIFAFFISFSPDHLPFLTAIVPMTRPQTWHSEMGKDMNINSCFRTSWKHQMANIVLGTTYKALHKLPSKRYSVQSKNRISVALSLTCGFMPATKLSFLCPLYLF